MNVTISLERTVGKLLKNNKLTLSVAESCTGGLVCNRITNIPGSSEYFIGGVIAYSDGIKKNLLNVNKVILEKNGAVSKEAVEAMARGIRTLLHTDIGLAITGVAGPTGGTKEKPVGLVWISLTKEDNVITKKFLWQGNRVNNKEKSAEAAVIMLKEYLEGLVWIQ